MSKRGSKIEYFLLVLMIAVIVSLGFILLFINKNTRSQFEISATQKVKGYIETLKKTRDTYTSEIVSKVKKNGMEVSHFYTNKDNTIPLPATLTILLGEEIAKNNANGVSVRLYSPFPFPWRAAAGGLKSDFSKRAWEALQENPTEPYFEIEPASNVNSQERLRYAIADVMEQACVDCHNSHPQTPKADWRTGDIRGILEVNAHLEDKDFQTINKNLNDLQIMSWAIMLVGLSIVGVFFGIIQRNKSLQ